MSQTPIYVKTGVLFRDAITIQDPSGNFVNTYVDADFTKLLSNGTTSGLSTTGITVTQKGTTGVYDLLIPASIFSANGNYMLVIYVTATKTYSWDQEYVATVDGFPGSAGTLSFTSSSGNGRVVDTSLVAISGATVYITQSNYITALTTNASGDWGPWYADPSAGAFTITVIKSGYAQATGSLTVGASSITGPGANLVMTAVSTASTITANELWSYARRMAHNKTGTQADVKIVQLVNDSIDRMSREWDSGWYERRGYLQFVAPYSTGSITLTNGSSNVLLTGGTWPTWAAKGRIFASNIILDVSVRVDATNVTLSANWGGPTTSGAGYTMFQNRYDLPVNFLEFGGILQGQTWPYKPLPVSATLIWTWENALTIGTQYSNGFSIAYNQLWVWPYPTVAQSVAYLFKARPAPLVVGTDLADIDPTWIEVLHKCIDYHVALYFGECVAGAAEECLKRYMDSLARLPQNDKNTSELSPVTGGYARNMPLWRSKAL